MRLMLENVASQRKILPFKHTESMDGWLESIFRDGEERKSVRCLLEKRDTSTTIFFCGYVGHLQQHRICQRIFFHLHPYLHLLWFCLHFGVNVYLSDCPPHHLQPLEEFPIGKIATLVHVVDTERRPLLCFLLSLTLN